MDLTDPKTIRIRTRIKDQVFRFKKLGLTDEEVVYWLKHTAEPKIGLAQYFQTIEELAALVEIPVALFRKKGTAESNGFQFLT